MGVTDPSRTLRSPDFVATSCVSLQNGVPPDGTVYSRKSTEYVVSATGSPNVSVSLPW